MLNKSHKMVYNIAEIKYTSCYPVICNLVPKRQTLCTQARAIKSKFLKISKMAFLFIYLLLLYLCLQPVLWIRIHFFRIRIRKPGSNPDPGFSPVNKQSLRVRFNSVSEKKKVSVVCDCLFY